MSVVGSYTRRGTNQLIFIQSNGQIAVGHPNCTVPDHIAARSRWTDGAPHQIAAGVIARGANAGRALAPFWGVLLDVPAADSVTGPNFTYGPINTGGGTVFFGIETTPSAADTENVLTIQASLDGSTWYAASGTTASLAVGALTAIATTFVEVAGNPPFVRLVVSAAANNAVTAAYAIKYGIRFAL